MSLEAWEGRKHFLRTAGEKLSWFLMETYGTHYPKSRWSLASWQSVGLGLSVCCVAVRVPKAQQTPQITRPLADPGSS